MKIINTLNKSSYIVSSITFRLSNEIKSKKLKNQVKWNFE